MKIKEQKNIKKCKSCRFFVEFANSDKGGWCHRNAPAPHARFTETCGQTEFEKYYYAPKVIAHFWCGQHEPIKKKVKQ
jgi:hypothetical protein